MGNDHETHQSRKIAMHKRNTLDMLKAWSLLPRVLVSIKEELGPALGSLLDAIATIGLALLSLIIIVLAPFFFWLSPIVTYHQMKTLKRKVDDNDVWSTAPYYKEEK